MSIQKTITLLVCVCILPVQMAVAQFAGGSGTSGDPYQISTAAQLAMADDTLAYYTSYFILVNDIDCSTDPGHPLWPRANQDPNRPDGMGIFGGNQGFEATFDGQGYSILNRTNSFLDTQMYKTFTIQNIVFSNVLIRPHYLSYLAGHVAAVMPTHNGGNGSFFNIQVYGVVSNNVGGQTGGMFAGLTTGMTVSNCTSYADVYGITAVGGISGSLSGSATIKNSACYGDVNGAGNNIGGLVGSLSGSIFQSKAAGTVRSSSGYYHGGLIGVTSGGGTIRECFATGDVYENGESGGLAGGTVSGGAGTTLIIDSYATGNVLGSYSGNRKGGFMGEYARFGTAHIIENCYSTGDMNSGSGGGFSGQMSTGGGIISNCFAAGGTIANSSGGFQVSGGVIYNCFWTNSATSDGVATKVGNESHFYLAANSPIDEWDTTGVWCLDGALLPCLRWDENCCPPAEGMVLIFE